jgi:hypothetical protein
MNTAKTILRRLFRVYAHIYHQHFDQICALGIEGELLVTQIVDLTPELTCSSLEHQLPSFPAVCRRSKHGSLR